MVCVGDDRGAVEMKWPDCTQIPMSKRLCIPCYDDPSQDLLPYFHSVIDFIDRQVTAGGKVLVHGRRCLCQAPAFMVAYLVWRKDCSVQEAVETLKSLRANIRIRGELLNQIWLWRCMSFWIWKDTRVPKAQYEAFLLRRWKLKQRAA
ncbi:Dual specificity protein phosphatase 3 [Amphichorda felina]